MVMGGDKEELKASEEYSSGHRKMSGLSPRSDHSNTEIQSPAYCFNDGNLHVIPVKIVSQDPREYGCYSFICIPR